MQEANIKNGCGCRICHGTLGVAIGINDLWTSNPEVAKLLLNKNDGFKYSRGNSKKIDFKCPTCGFVKKDSISNVVLHGFSCPKCGDGFSYPNKFMFSLLEQLNVFFETEKSFEWSKIGRSYLKYDFYIQSFDMIVEMHGEQHYKETNGFGKGLNFIKDRDNQKQGLALENGIHHYIIVDSSKSELDFIRNSVLNSLGEYFDLSKIDWEKCEKFCLNSSIKRICDLWENNKSYTTRDVAKVSKVSIATVENYLKRGNDIGLCFYNKTESARRSHAKVLKKVKCVETEEIFDCVNIAAEKYDTNPNTIRACCKGRKKHAGNKNGERLSWQYVSA